MVHETSLETRYYETDMMGHISNTSYFLYIEVARVDFLVDLGLAGLDRPWGIIVASVKCDFLKQLFAKQHILLRTQVSRIGTKSAVLEHQILSEDGETMALGESVIVHFDKASQRSIPLDQEMIDKLEQYLKP